MRCNYHLRDQRGFSIGSLILNNGASQRNFRRPIYDAALNKFARPSMSAALTSPIAK